MNRLRESRYGAQPQRTQCLRAQNMGPVRSKIRQQQDRRCLAPPDPSCYEENVCNYDRPIYAAQPRRNECRKVQQMGPVRSKIRRLQEPQYFDPPGASHVYQDYDDGDENLDVITVLSNTNLADLQISKPIMIKFVKNSNHSNNKTYLSRRRECTH